MTYHSCLNNKGDPRESEWSQTISKYPSWDDEIGDLQKDDPYRDEMDLSKTV
jgi:hypothetical protein